MKRLLTKAAVTVVVVGGALGLAAGSASAATHYQPQDCYGNPFCIVNCALNPSACPTPPPLCTYTWCGPWDLG